MFLVTAVKDKYEEAPSVEIAGVFTTEAKAYEAKSKVQEWMEANGFEDAEVFVTPIEPDHLAWYDIEQQV